MDFLTVTTPDGMSSQHELQAQSLTLGRLSSNDLPLDDASVSRIHAKIVRRTDGYYVLDAGSKHGTLVNARRISEPTLLQPGDQILVGRTLVSFNGAPTVPIELIDTPLDPGSGTKILSAASLRSGSMPGTGSKEARGAPSGSVQSAALKIIYKADEELVFHRPLLEILERIMDLADEAVKYERGVLMLLQGGELVKQVVRVPSDEVGEGMKISRTIANHVVSKQESILTSDAKKDPRFDIGHSVVLQRLRSVMCVPLWNNREVIGLLYVDNRHQAEMFTESDLSILTHLANVAAVKIENAQLFEHALAAETMKQELDTAAEIQNLLLPREGPSIPGFQLEGSSRPCHAVGGDYYDFIPLPDGRYAFALGDVAGKGMPAALIMSSLQASLQALIERDLSPEETIARLNHLLCRKIPANRFVTLFYGVIDPEKRTLTYTNAGHNSPAVLRSDGGVEHLSPSGPPLGFFDSSTYAAKRIVLQPNDLLVCYSDGITEAMDPGGVDFGEEKLISILRADPGATPDDFVGRIFEAIDTHHAGTNPADDLTLVVLKRFA
jgi:serine phosphatase RsbU (regulator of sigma subunit)